MGYGAALAACLLNGVWLACIIYLESLGDIAAQAQSQPGIFRLSVGAALLLTIFQVPILLVLGLVAFERSPARALIGGVLYALYIPLNLIAYYLFGRLAPMVHTLAVSMEPDAPFIADLVEIGHPLGLTGNLPILGYGMLGLAWCLLSSALWMRGRLWKATAGVLFVSGALSALGAIGGFIDVAWLITCCFLGGVASFPALALLGVVMWREARP